MAVQTPIARACAEPWNALRMSASELGTSSAPATPCRPRARIRTSAVGATAHATEAIPKPSSPQNRTRLRPNRSDSDPASRMTEPSVSR